jgi:Uma2 family endonuclease
MSGSEEVKPTGVKLTWDDYMLFPEDGMRHELIDGEHYVTPAPFLRHQEIVGRLHLAIGMYLMTHPIGRVFVAPLDVILSKFDVVEPDLLYVSNERAPELLKDWVRGAPDLVIEVGSESTRTRDETVKCALYERAGVIEYWIVDPEIDVVRIYQRANDRFARPKELSRRASDVLATELLPGLEIALNALFRD